MKRQTLDQMVDEVETECGQDDMSTEQIISARLLTKVYLLKGMSDHYEKSWRSHFKAWETEMETMQGIPYADRPEDRHDHFDMWRKHSQAAKNLKRRWIACSARLVARIYGIHYPTQKIMRKKTVHITTYTIFGL